MNIGVLRECCSNRKILWSTHAASRIQQRGILRVDVVNCIMNGEIIEDYPNDYPHPSCLIFGYGIDKKVIHVVAGYDGNNLFIITAYYPNTEKFLDDLKTRR